MVDMGSPDVDVNAVYTLAKIEIHRFKFAIY
jgi:hypothetical protein